ncbi:MAG: S8 family serine peptidase [Candidatus Thorarchaeota archaeon]
MYRRLLVILLILSAIQVPMGISTGVIVSSNSQVPSSPHIESMLRMELSRYETGQTLAHQSGIQAVLKFENELSSDQISLIESMGISFSRRNGNPVHVGSLYLAHVGDITSLDSLGTIGLLQASSGSKQFFPSLSSSVPAIDVPEVWTGLERDGLPIDGTGITVAVIDTGATWLHPAFWRASTGQLTVIPSGSDFYVDIDGDFFADPNEGPISTVTGQTGSTIDYSDDYMFIDVDGSGLFEFSEGDRWIGGIDLNNDSFISLSSEPVVVLGESKIAVLYDQHSSNVYYRGVNLTSAPTNTDTIGHGTHVASIVAGGQIGMTSWVGVAPGADLVIIRSPLTSADVLDGIAFAIENGASVINMSFSSYLGFLDGTDLEDLAISEALNTRGAVCTLAAGNLGTRPKHARFEVPSGSQVSATLSVHSPPDNSFLNILWRSDNNDEHLILTPPEGDDIDLGAFESIANSPFVLNEPNITANVFPDISDRGTNRIIIQVSEEYHDWVTGSWTVTMTNPSGNSIWVDGYAWDNLWDGTGMRFASNLDYSRTISSPGTSDLGITVASYNEQTQGISSSSSVGPRIDGVAKPTVTAPGDVIRAAFNSLSSLWTTRSGTSMAAPHVAGVMALLQQASGNGQGWNSLSALLQGAGGYDSHFTPPSNSWGYGLCSPLLSSQYLLTPSDGPIYWNDVPSVHSESTEPSINPGIDILNVKAYLQTEETRFRIEMDGTANFNSSNKLTIEWNLDSSMASGQTGIDMKVVLTDGEASVLEWSGSSFTPTGYASWYNESTAVYITVEHDSSITHGSLQIITGNQTDELLDDTPEIVLQNQWGPLIEDVKILYEGTLFSVNVTISDKDSNPDLLDIDFNIVDGGISVIDTISETGVYTIIKTFNISEYIETSVLSLVLSINDESYELTLPPIMLSSGGALQLKILEATLDQSIVRIGFLISERITGRIVVQGHLLAEEVGLSFVPDFGSSLNLTLNGNDGIYDFDISPSGLAVSTYSVFAVAVAKVGGTLSQHMGTITVIQDYSNAILIGGIGLALVIIYYVARRYGTRTRRDDDIGIS